MNRIRPDADSASDSALDPNDPVRIATFYQSAQAYLARAILADNGIPAFVENELASLYTPAGLYGYFLVVAARDVHRAEPIIQQFLHSIDTPSPRNP